MQRPSAVLALALAAAGALPARADDWPQWRGPARNGHSAEKGWLDVWPAGGPPIAWKAEVGRGLSSFVVAKGRAFTMGNEDNTDTVFCFDAANGRALWSHKYPSDLGDKYFLGGTTGTPTVDGERLFTLGRWGDLHCFEAATGKVVWSKNVTQETGLPAPEWGFGGSPLVLGDLLLLNVGEAGLALDRATGKVAWKSAAKESGYSTPLPFGKDGLVLFSSTKAYTAVDPKTGREAWRTPWVTQYGVNAADPIVDGERLFLSTGYNKGAALFTIGKGEPEWRSRVLNSQMNAAVQVGGHLYGVSGDQVEKAAPKAELKCVELATGEEQWSVGGFGTGAVTVADGKLIALSELGELMVAPVSPERFRPTARAKVLDGRSWTVPVLANGRIYCRSTEGSVVCVDVRKP